MRPRCHSMLVVLILVMAGRAVGQDKEPKAGAVPHPNVNAIEVRFADDSTVKMMLQHASLEISTRYGKLTVPVEEIRRVEFGRRIPDETVKRIDAAIVRLGHADFKQREAAGSELVELRELAYAPLQQAAHNGNPEIARRAKDALKIIGESVSADKLQLPRHDTVVAVGFTIIGQIETPALKVRTPYFGETSLQLTDLRSLRSLANEREMKVAVDAARYGAPQEAWLDSGVDVRVGSTLQIVATGTVDLRPVPGEAGTFLSGPDGQSARGPRGGGGLPAGAGFPGGGGGRGGGRGAFTPQSPGALLGRIGEFGRVFVVGSRYDGAASEDGKLYLRIVPSTNSTESSGSYDVRVTTGR